MAKAATPFEKWAIAEMAKLEKRVKRLEQGERKLMANTAALDQGLTDLETAEAAQKAAVAQAITDLEHKIASITDGTAFAPEIARLRALTTGAQAEAAAATAADPGAG